MAILPAIGLKRGTNCMVRQTFIFATILAAAIADISVAGDTARGSVADRARIPLADINGSESPRSDYDSDKSPPPADVRALWEKLQIALAREEFDDALALLDRPQWTQKVSWQPLLIAKSELLLRAGRVQQAETTLQNAAASGTAAPRFQFLLGDVAARRGDDDRAIEHFRNATKVPEAADDDPYVTGSWFRLAQSLEAAGYKRAAAKAYRTFDRRVWSLYPEHRYALPVSEMMPAVSGGTLSLQWDLWLDIGMPEQALASAAEAQAARPDDLTVTRFYLQGLVDTGRGAEAVAAASEKIRTAGLATPEFVDSARPLFAVLARALADTDADFELKSDFHEHIRPEVAIRITTHIAESLRLLDEPARSAAIWRAGQKEVEADPRLIAGEVRALLAAGEQDRAVESLTAYVSSNGVGGLLQTFLPDRACDGDARIELVFDADDDETDASRTIAHALLALHQREFPIVDELADRLRKVDEDQRVFADQLVAASALGEYDWQQAISLTEPILADDPRNADAALLAAIANAGLDQEQRAKAHFKTALAGNKDACRPALALGEFHARTDAALKAQRYLQLALARDPFSVRAAEGLFGSYLDSDTPKIELARGVLTRVESGIWPAAAQQRMKTRLRFVMTPWTQEHVAALAADFANYPADIETGLRLIEGKLRLSQFAEALMPATALRQRCPQRDEVLRWYAEAQRYNLNFASAAATMGDLADRYPLRTSLKIAHAEYLHWSGDTEAAITLLEDHIAQLENDQTAARVFFSLYAMTVRTRQFDRAEQFLRTHGERFPAFGWEERLIDLYVVSDQADKALAIVKRDLDANPREETQQWRYLKTLLRVNRDDEARTYLAKIVSESTQTNKIALKWEQLDALLQLEDFDQAVDVANHLQMLLENGDRRFRDSVTAAVKLREAQAYLGLNNPSAALLTLKDAFSGISIEELATRDQFANDAVQALLVAKQYDGALSFLEDWHSRAGGLDAEPLYLLWKQAIFQAMGRLDDYFAIAEKRLQQTPGDATLNNDLGYSLTEQDRRLDDALRMIRLAVAKEPDNAAFLDSLGWVYYKLNKMPEAVKFLGRAVSYVDGQDPILYDHYADALYRSGRQEEATKTWRKALAMIREPGPAQIPNDDPEFEAKLAAKIAAVEKNKEPTLASIPDAQE